MNTITRNFLFLLLLVSSNLVLSQYNYTKLEKQAREKIFELKFNEVSTLLEKTQSSNSLYLLSYNIFIKNLIVGGEANYIEFENQFDISYTFIKKIKGDSVKNIYLAELLLQNSIIKLLNRDFISGAINFIESYGYFKDARKLYPNSITTLKLTALYNIIAGITPDKGKVFLSTIGLKGDINIGMKQMNSFVNKAEKTRLFYTEAFIINKLVSAFMKEDVGVVELPLPKYNIQQNSLNIFSDIIIDYKEHNYTNINKNILLLADKKTGELPYLYYLIGVVNSIENTNESVKNLNVFIDKNKSKHFVKATYWQLARIAILQNDTLSFNKNKLLTLKQGVAFTEADKQAVAEAELEQMPNVILLKARLYFDAGNYRQSKQLLLSKNNKNKFKTTDEYAEFFYRLARTYYMLNDTANAIKYYKLVLEKNIKSNRYFVPYSALQLGIIYEEELNITKAKYFYNIALELNNGEYKNSIKHKAKSRLAKL